MLLERQVLRLNFDLGENFGQVSSLMKRYANVPMSLADACLVRMAELMPETLVFTVDRGFRIYRRHGRQKIALLMPREM